jgi:hypothetical protein
VTHTVVKYQLAVLSFIPMHTPHKQTCIWVQMEPKLQMDQKLVSGGKHIMLDMNRSDASKDYKSWHFVHPPSNEFG